MTPNPQTVGLKLRHQSTRDRVRLMAIGHDKKKCPKCGETKSLASFAPRGKYRDTSERYGYCKPCHAIYQREANRTVALRKYGITEAQYQKMLVKGGGACWLCGGIPKTRRLAVDHDHKTGRIRGVLCFRCNRFRVSSDTAADAPMHRRIADYLTSTFDGRK